MHRAASVVAAIVLCVAGLSAQERKIEVSLFAGGYFSAGYQSFQQVSVGVGPLVSGGNGRDISREFTPVNEPNSGIFGARASYDLTSRFSVEGTFGFSPAGRSTELPPPVPFDFVDSPSLPTPDLYFDPFAFSLLIPSVRDSDTYHYAANAVFHWRKPNGWAPFLAAGLGAVRRTAEFAFSPITIPPVPAGGTGGGQSSSIVSTILPSPSETNFSVNFGGGVKKYFSDRWGIRFDFRDYVSGLGGDILSNEDAVNNLEVSLGLLFKL